MRSYEGLFIFDSSLTPESLKSTLKKVEEVIKKRNGKVEKQTETGKKSLGYSIKKKSSGLVVVMSAQLDPESLSKITKELRLIKEILRFTFVRADSLPKIDPKKKKAEEVPAGV